MTHNFSRTPNTVFTNTPCLNETTLPNNCCISWEIYSCEEHVRDLLLSAVVAVGEMGWKRHVQLIIRNMAKATAHRHVFIKPIQTH
jgi:hypothetical protein